MASLASRASQLATTCRACSSSVCALEGHSVHIALQEPFASICRNPPTGGPGNRVIEETFIPMRLPAVLSVGQLSPSSSAYYGVQAELIGARALSRLCSSARQGVREDLGPDMLTSPILSYLPLAASVCCVCECVLISLHPP